MSRYSLEEMRRQTAALAADLPGLVATCASGAARAVASIPRPERVVVLGSGDSVNAAIAVRGAFGAGGAVEYAAATATEYLDHPPTRRLPADRVAVIGVSASGGNSALLAAVTAARRAGSPTIAVTARAESPLAAAADATLAVTTDALSAPSPGIRTYQGTLVGLLAIAGELNPMRPPAIDGSVTDLVGRSAHLALGPSGELASVLASAPVVVVVGSGPGLGTARHVAAKITEAAAQPAVGVELEDWWHVHRFGHPPQCPVVVLVPSGPGRDAALAMARRTSARRPVVLAAPESDGEASAAGLPVVPSAGGGPVPARPLVDSVFAGPLAVALAQARDVVPFANP